MSSAAGIILSPSAFSINPILKVSSFFIEPNLDLRFISASRRTMLHLSKFFYQKPHGFGPKSANRPRAVASRSRRRVFQILREPEKTYVTFS